MASNKLAVFKAPAPARDSPPTGRRRTYNVAKSPEGSPQEGSRRTPPKKRGRPPAKKRRTFNDVEDEDTPKKPAKRGRPPKGSPKGSPRGPPKGSPKSAPKRAPKGSPKAEDRTRREEDAERRERDISEERAQRAADAERDREQRAAEMRRRAEREAAAEQEAIQARELAAAEEAERRRIASEERAAAKELLKDAPLQICAANIPKVCKSADWPEINRAVFMSGLYRGEAVPHWDERGYLTDCVACAAFVPPSEAQKICFMCAQPEQLVYRCARNCGAAFCQRCADHTTPTYMLRPFACSQCAGPMYKEYMEGQLRFAIGRLNGRYKLN